MATARQLRILALQALYALDMSDGRDPESIRAALDAGSAFEPEEAATPARGPAGAARRPAPPPPEPAEFTASERRKAFEAAQAAWASREEADEFFLTLAPTWPAGRQPVIDRSILRLSFHEMRSGKTAPKIVVSEAIDIARAFSTEKSPAFINALLDKALKRFEGTGWDADDTDDTEDAGSPDTPGPAPQAGLNPSREA